MYRIVSVLLVAIGFTIFGLAARQTALFVVEMRESDKQQDAQIEELEQQLRDLRASLDKPTVPPPQPEDDAIRDIPVGRSPVFGPADARVTIVGFIDYQCPFCSRVEPTLQRVLEANPDVRVVVKHNPLAFHRQAKDAAIVAECAHRQGAFGQAHRVLYEKQRELESYLRDLSGLDVNRAELERCRESGAAREVVEAEMAQAARIGATGTPTFFINGKRFTGAQPYESFQAKIDDARREAIASGIPASRYYVEGVLAKATVR